MKLDFLMNHVIGYIDSYGSVHSIVLHISDSSCHRDIGLHNFKSWRYISSENTIQPSPFSSKFDEEDYDKVRRHLEKKYGLKSWLKENYYY